MNERERVLSILKGEKPDQVPWFADLDYWMAYLRVEGLMPEQYRVDVEAPDYRPSKTTKNAQAMRQGAGIFQLHHDLGTGFYLQGFFPFKEIHDYEEHVEQATNSRTTRVVTPFGEISQVEKWLPDAYCWSYPVRFIKGWRDLKSLRYMFEHTHYEPAYQRATARYEWIGDNGIVLCYLPRSPFMVTTVLLAGIETVTFCVVEAPEEFDETMEALTRNLDLAADLAVNSPAECLMIPDNISSEVVGKRFYNRYVRPFHERWTRRIHAARKISCVHLDGTLKGLVREISEAGFDFIEAMTPHPVGDLPIEEWKDWVNEKVVMWGGTPGGYFTDLISDEEFDAFIIRLLKTMTSEPRYVLGVADQVPPRSRSERIARVRSLVNQYGRFQ